MDHPASFTPGGDEEGRAPGDSTADPASDPTAEPPVATPSGYLLLSLERLAELEVMVASGDPTWEAFKQRVDERLDEQSIYNDSPENRALVYLLTGEPIYARAAWDFAHHLMQTEDVRFDSYLHFGDLMRHAAIVLSYCGEALAPSERDALIEYLESWTDELWFDNQGSGWGLADPGNNYHHAFLQGTAYAGYALEHEKIASGSVYVDLLLDKLGEDGGVVGYLATHVDGGGWHEGTNYGERSKQRLYETLSVVASMGGPNHLYDEPYGAQSVHYAVYELQPDGESLYPGGDLARDSAMLVTPAERDYLTMARFWLGKGKAPSLASWYLDEVADSFDQAGYRGLAFKDLVFGSAAPALAPSELPLAYVAAGTGWLNLRSGWGEDATSITISAPATIEQSHQHIDAASFVIFKRGWLALDATSESDAGLNWSSCAHNGICVAGAERREGQVGSLTAYEDAGVWAHVAVDATQQYRHRPGSDVETMLNEHTRDLVYLRPDRLVVYDRVAPKAGHSYEWRLHLPVAPSPSDGLWKASHGAAGLSLRAIVGQVIGVESDGDLPGGPSDAFRLVAIAADAAAGRFLNVVAVADGGAPSIPTTPLSCSGEVDGVALDDAVVLFSRKPKGAAISLPFSCTLATTEPRLFVVTGLTTAVNATVSVEGASKTTTWSAGGSHAPGSSGAVALTL